MAPGNDTPGNGSPSDGAGNGPNGGGRAREPLTADSVPGEAPEAAALPRKPGRAESRWLRGLQGHARGPLTVAIAAPLVAGVLVVFQAFLLAHVLDRAISGHAAAADLLPGVIAFALLIIGRALIGRVGEEAGAVAAERIKALLRRSLFASLMAAPPAWVRGRASGAMASVLMEQVEAIDGFFSRFLPAMIAAAVLPIAFAVTVMPFEPIAGLLFFVSAPMIPLFMALVGWGAEAASRRHLNAFARLSGFFADRVRGIATLKLYGRAEAEADAVKAASDDLHQRTLAVMRIAFLSSAVLEFFAALGVAGVALYIGLTYLDLISIWSLPLTLQTGLFCLVMAPEVYLPLRVLAAHYHDRANALAAVNEIGAAFDSLPAIEAEPGNAAAPAPAAAHPVAALGLDIGRLRLSTPDGARMLLDGVDLAIAPGEHVAIIGESGIGKSTLIEALCRLRAFEGDIRLGGRALADIDEAELRATMAVLGQRPHLFRGTLADNIRLGRRDASDAAVAEAARLAGVSAFADSLPDGLATFVGERGHGVSGGEAQRVALARIFLRDPAVILLDEPTAHLDGDTEHRVLDAIAAFARGRTLVVATHSPAVAQRMDRIFRIAGGGLMPVPHRRGRRDGTAAADGQA